MVFIYQVKAILGVFTRTIDKLEKLAANNRRNAGIKTAKADVLDQEAGQLLDEVRPPRQPLAA